MEMTEIEREDILAQRQEEIQRIQDKRNLDAMLRDRTGTGEDSVSKAAKRQSRVLEVLSVSLTNVQANMLSVAPRRKSRGSSMSSRRNAKPKTRRSAYVISPLCTIS